MMVAGAFIYLFLLFIFFACSVACWLLGIRPIILIRSVVAHLKSVIWINLG